MPKAPKHRYSKKVRALGYGIILLQIATVALLFLAVYSNVRTVYSLGSSLTSLTGNGLSVQNVTSNGQIQRAYVLPKITNNGYLTVSLSVNAAFLNSQGQTVGNPLSQSLTIAPGQTRPLVLPTGFAASSDVSGIQGVRLSVEINSIFGLVGGGFTATVIF